jgi:hypothetical protein
MTKSDIKHDWIHNDDHHAHASAASIADLVTGIH